MMTKDLQILELNNTVKCKLDASSIHGIGIFAMRNISKGDKLYCFPAKTPRWYNVPYGSLTKLLPEIRELLLQRWASIINGSMFISPNDMSWLCTYINHSNNPNYDVATDRAIVDIKEGEEITEDYRLMNNAEEVYPFLKNLTE